MNRLDRRKREVRERILQAAFDLFLSQGIEVTKIEEICERADVANRTFFNHFPTRQDLIRALAEQRLIHLHDVLFDRSGQPLPARLIGFFDDISAELLGQGDTYREMIGVMLIATPTGYQRGFILHDTFLEMVKQGVADGEITSRHAPAILADIIVGALVRGIVNWTVDNTFALDTGLHDVAAALVDLLMTGQSTRP
ncbi:TetR/AcrR family transcriptional regulator [Nocardia sp. NPDC004123]